MSPFAKYLMVAGPTGSGKTEFAVQVAERLDGEIINADSVQLFKDHIIGAAAPTTVQLNRVPHHLFGVLSGDTLYDVSQFLNRAKEVFAEVVSRGKLPIIVGGSNLYLQALLDGLSDLPKADEDLRSQLELKETAVLYSLLLEKDPERASELHANDRVRILRALEVTIKGGKPFSELVKLGRIEPLPSSALVVVVLRERNRLYERIRLRAGAMVQGGILEEVKHFTSVFGERWQAASSLGYAQCLKHLREGGSDEGLAEEIEQATRHFAKRQMTFWRNSPSKFGWKVRPSEEEDGHLIGDESGGRGRPREHREGFRALRLDCDEMVSELSSVLKRAPAAGGGSQHEVWYWHAS